jgi:hypothetical protein
MKEFGYSFEEMDSMTPEQFMFLRTGMQVEARERRSAQRRAKLKGR